jgi:hypothetical protein
VMLTFAQWKSWRSARGIRNIGLSRNDPLWFAVERIRDNRMRGILQEVAELIDDTDSPDDLRRFGQSLKLLSDAARGRGYRRGGRFY